MILFYWNTIYFKLFSFNKSWHQIQQLFQLILNHFCILKWPKHDHFKIVFLWFFWNTKRYSPLFYYFPRGPQSQSFFIFSFAHLYNSQSAVLPAIAIKSHKIENFGNEFIWREMKNGDFFGIKYTWWFFLHTAGKIPL